MEAASPAESKEGNIGAVAGDGDGEGSEAVVVVKRKRGRPRKDGTQPRQSNPKSKSKATKKGKTEASKAPWFPNAVIGRIIKSSLPRGVALQQEARQQVHAAALTFVHYLSSHALDVATAHKRSTLSASDVMTAVERIHMHAFVDPLQQLLQEEGAKKDAKKSKGAPSE